jgi:hypothetical protein
VLRTGAFKVSGKKLLSAAGNDYWRKLLTGPFKEGKSDEITLEDDTVASMELWLQVFHKKVVEDSYLIPIEEVWNAIQVSRKYLFHLEKLNNWFKGYVRRLDKKNFEYSELRQLLYPYQAFDHANAFAYVTKRLVHEGVGHIEELNPTRYGHLRCGGRVIRELPRTSRNQGHFLLTGDNVEQLNAAKDSLIGKIVAGLFEPLDTFCVNKCEPYEKCIAAYLEGVKRTGIWPLHKKSNKDVIDSPGVLNWQSLQPARACSSCRMKLAGGHINTRDDILEYWDGLCLDCMDVSRPKTGDRDKDYWLHNNMEEWDTGCRLDHDRNTWYFSFMGRPELIDKFKQEQQARKRARQYRDDSD